MIYLLRHGETRWNAEGRIQGSGDSPLTERGKTQMEALGHRLAREPFTRFCRRIFISPLGRAIESSEIVLAALRDHEIHLNPSYPSELKERSHGPWEGLKKEDLKKTPEWEKYQRDRWNHKPGGTGESHAEFYLRVESFWNRIPYHEDIIVLAHQQTVGTSVKILCNLPFGTEPRIDNTEFVAVSRLTSEYQIKG